MDLPSEVRLPISLGQTVDPVVHEISEACRECEDLIVKAQERHPELYVARICPRDDSPHILPQFEAIAAVEVMVTGEGKGSLRLTQNTARGSSKEPYSVFCARLLRRLADADIWQPEESKGPLGFHPPTG